MTKPKSEVAVTEGFAGDRQPPHQLPRGPTELVSQLLAAFLHEGDQVLDATAGNGHDTLLLARCVGDAGRVWALDIQPAALSNTRQRLEAAGLAHRAELIQADHAQLADSLPSALRGRLAAAVFNLGYLPGADHAVITRSTSTLAALDQIQDWLAVNGLLVVTVYPGHPGGAEEADAVSGWVARLPRPSWRAWSAGLANVAATAPRSFLMQRLV